MKYSTGASLAKKKHVAYAKHRALGNPFVIPFARDKRFGAWAKITHRNGKIKWHFYSFSQFFLPSTLWDFNLKKVHTMHCNIQVLDRRCKMVAFGGELKLGRLNAKKNPEICKVCYGKWRAMLKRNGYYGKYESKRINTWNRVKHRPDAREIMEKVKDTPWYDL